MSAYFILHARVHDAAKMGEYVPKAVESLAPYDPEVLAIDDESEVVEGSSDQPRTVVIKFKSKEDAMAWYTSDAYKDALALRLDASEGVAFLVNGLGD